MGWTFEHINALPMPYVIEFLEELAENPPTHELVAAYLGYKSSSSSGSRSAEPTVEEMRLMSGPVRPFNSLPPALQEVMKLHAGEKIN